MNVKLTICILFFSVSLSAQDQQPEHMPRKLSKNNRPVNGQKEGIWEYFYRSGERLAVENFTNG